MTARRIGKKGHLYFEQRHIPGKDIPHADCLSGVQTEESGKWTFVAALTTSDKGINKVKNNPWEVLRDTDRKSNKTETQKNIAKVFFGWKRNKNPTSNN